MVSDECRHLEKPSTAQFVVSCTLMAWLLLSYVPQWARMISRKSAEGLSTLFILLGSLSGVCAIANIMMLPSSAVEIGCCRSNKTFACISSLLGMVQVTLGIACFWVVLFLYVYFSEEEAELEIHGRRPSLSGPERTFHRARRAWMILIAACAFAFAILIISAIILNRFPWVSQSWANIMGVTVAVLACVQWIPQAWTSWHLGHLGSLSLAGLCLQAPYTWMFGINMMIRVGLAGWSAWIVYVLVGTMQLLLITMGTYFATRDRVGVQEGKTGGHVHSASGYAGWGSTRSGAQSAMSQTASELTPDERTSLLACSPAPRSH